MNTVVLFATTALKFKVEFDDWITAVGPTSVEQVVKGHLKGEWIVIFTP